jgi:hypothetical protein
MAMREELIHRRVDRVLAANPADKVLLMAGSTHLMNADLASRWDRSCIAVVRHDCGQRRRPA